MTESWTEIHETCVKAIMLNIDYLSDLISDYEIPKLKNKIDALHNWENEHYNLLFHSVVCNNQKTFEALLRHGANPIVTNNRGFTILHLLIRRRLLTWAELCIQYMSRDQQKTFVNLATNNGWTPLMTAAECGLVNFTKWLINHGADMNKQLADGTTALEISLKSSRLQIPNSQNCP